jgi:hypothetical protein
MHNRYFEMRGIYTFLLYLMTISASASDFQLASFSVNVTIPLNHRCMGVIPVKSKIIADSLYVHGFVLIGGKHPLVVCAVDWCEIRNGSYDQWRSVLAKAARTTPQHVIVTALHQHDAPVIDIDAQTLLSEVGLKDELFNVEWHDQILAKVGREVSACLRFSVPVTHYGTSAVIVEGIASNRRVVLEDGSVSYDRGSRSGGNQFMANAPVGEIDPELKTISFFNGDKLLVQLHSYATHPMSHYGQGVVSSDFVGLARARLQQDDQSIHQIFVPGCAGDVTAGKFNDGSEKDRQILIDRLYLAMTKARQNTERHPLIQLVVRNAKLSLPFHPGDHLSKERLSHDLHDKGITDEKRILAAMGLASRKRVERGQPIDFPCIDLGNAQIVLFPGESFVGYQIMAQKQAGASFVMSIGYGECWTGYIPTEEDFANNFSDPWLWVGPGSEARMRKAIEQVIRK